MAAQSSPLRRWKPFFGAFDSVDAAIEAADPVLFRSEFRRARGDILELLCDAADDDHAEAERLCLALDDMMAESLETLRLVPAMPTVLATTDLGKWLRALRKHESERVRLLAGGIVSGWRASLQDDLSMVRAALHKLDNVTERMIKIVDRQVPPADASTKQPVKIPEGDRVLKTAKIAAEPPLPKITVSPAAGIVRADRCSEEKMMEAAKRKFRDAYKEADDAKRRRRTPMVEAPEMPEQRQRSRASCAGSMVKKTFSVTKHLHRV